MLRRGTPIISYYGRVNSIGPELQLHAIVTSVRYGRNYAVKATNFFEEAHECSGGRYPLIFDCFSTIFDYY